MDWKFWIYVWITALIRLAFIVNGTVVWEDRVRFLREPNDKLIVNAGSDVELPCLAVDGTSNSSGRRLSVSWMRNGILARDLTPRSNGSLILRNVQIEYEAIYQCAVLSERYGVVLSQRANLTVSKITNFTEEPQDVVVSIGGTARFQCIVAATTAPSATVTWFHRDLPLINDVQRFRILASGILQIVGVKQIDEGPYHCVASNVAGNITSRSATLTTSNESVVSFSEQHSPIRVLKAPNNVSVVGEQTAIFECLFEGADDVIWKKIDESPISSKAYRIGSNLIIEHVSRWDEGTYACVGSHASAKPVTLLAQLSVDSPPEIRKLPEEKFTRRGEWWRFHCDTASKPAPEIAWYKDGERLRSHGRVKIFPNEEQPPARLEKPSGEINYGRDLLISSARAEDVGVYQCFASNYLGTTSAAAALSYLDVDIEGPSNLTATVLPNQRDIALTWQPPSSLDEQYHLTVYIVHFHESDAGSENTVAVQQDACHGGVCRTICCSNVELVPHTNYTFWVDALVVQQSDPLFTRMTEPVVVTSGDAVSATVAPLMVQELQDPSKVHLSWTAPPIQELRGRLLEYRVEIKEKTDDGDVFRPLIIVPLTSADYEVDGLVPGGVVYFRVIPRTRAGYPELLPEKTYPWFRYKTRTVNSSDDAPAAPIVETHALNSTSVVVQWTSTSGDNVSKWIISAFKSSDGRRIARSDVDGSLNSVILLGLASDTLYQISVAAVSSGGGAGLSSSRLVRTSGTVQPAVISIPPNARDPVIPFPTPKCQLVGPAKMKVSWNTPPMKIVKYALRYSLLPDDNEPLNVSAHVKLVETTANFIVFTDLTPGRNYLFAARAENSDGYKSAFSDDISCFVPMTKPPPPANVDVTVVNGTSLLITWVPSPPAEGMGEILFYHVRYAANLVDPVRWKEVIVNSSNTSVYISNLNSSAVYFVSVSAENEAGRGAESPAKAAHVGSVTGGDVQNQTPTVIFQTSYKEGIIIGICIALICAAICAAVIIIRSRREQHFCIGCIPGRRRSTSSKSPNGHISNGHCGGERRIELAEIQTLLPRLIENAESDTKGGNGFYGPRGYPVSRANFSLPPPTNGLVESAAMTQEQSQPHNELLTVSVQSPCIESDQQREQSSDLSHSPATGSSLGSWVHSNNGEPINGILQKQHHGSISMPNLFDSGIGFDDLSTSMPYHGRYLPFPISASPRRECALMANGDTAVDSVTLPGCGLMGNGAVENAYQYPKNGKVRRLREMRIPQQGQESNGGRAATALGPTGSLLSNSRATSQCTC